MDQPLVPQALDAQQPPAPVTQAAPQTAAVDVQPVEPWMQQFVDRHIFDRLDITLFTHDLNDVINLCRTNPSVKGMLLGPDVSPKQALANITKYCRLQSSLFVIFLRRAMSVQQLGEIIDKTGAPLVQHLKSMIGNQDYLVTIGLAFDPNAEFLREMRDFFKNLLGLPQVFFDLKVKPNLIAGCEYEYKSRKQSWTIDDLISAHKSEIDEIIREHIAFYDSQAGQPGDHHGDRGQPVQGAGTSGITHWV